MSTAHDAIARLAFTGTWRRYQELALAAFEADRAAGNRHTHVVAPPGSGKTLVGVEIVRRLGAPALVLVPNTAVQAQWLAAVGRFGGAGVVAADPSAPVACLTYQALCRLDDPADVLGDLAERRWAAERAEATAQTPAEAAQEGRAFTGEAAERRGRELRSVTASLKREIARAEHGELKLGDLLSDAVRERVATMRANGLGTLVLDECHHLASLWGYAVRAVIEELGDLHVVGLTATPPEDISGAEEALYEHLLGPVDFTVPTPAVVREGFLAPFQELAWLATPLDGERRWLAEHDVRFQELVTTLHEDLDGPLSFPGWVTTRLRHREGEEGGASVGWAAFQRRNPSLARAGARFLASAGLSLPPDVPRGEGYREPPDLEDWLVLLQDYALRCLRASPLPEAADRDAAVSAALRDLGFTLTRRGIRRGRSDVDRLLTASAAKPLALVEVVACEEAARGDKLRALVLCDAEKAEVRADSELAGVLAAGAGTAPEAVRALAADVRTAFLRPLLVSGKAIRCSPDDADALVAALSARAGADVGPLSWEVDEDGLARIAASGSAWAPRVWVGLATAAFTAGDTRVLVGTRALLGEGWDAPCVNVLVDLGSATTSVSVTQSRGRSLRLDPADPEKIASNWDVVCVAPELARGDADYRRFVRKHLHLLAPSEDGEIEAGPGHVHPSLGPFAPPPADQVPEVNRLMARRAAEHGAARLRWAIGTPYLAEERETLVVRARRPGAPAAGLDVLAWEGGVEGLRESPPHYRISQRVPGGVGAAALVASPLVALAAGPLALAGLVLLPLAAAWAGGRLDKTAKTLSQALPLDLAAFAVCETYRDLGEITHRAAASLAIEPRASGYLRVWLRNGTVEENARFSSALSELLEPPPAPRYLVSRLTPGRPGTSRWSRLARALTFRNPFETRWHGVPSDLGRNKDRAGAFAAAWARWLGPSRVVFSQREDGREAGALAGAQAADYEVRSRRVWT